MKYKVMRFGHKISRVSRGGIWFEIGWKDFSTYEDAFEGFYDNSKRKPRIWWAVIEPKKVYKIEIAAKGLFDETDYPYILYFKLKEGKYPTVDKVKKYQDKHGYFDEKHATIIESKVSKMLKEKGYDCAYFKIDKKILFAHDQLFYLGNDIKWVKDFIPRED